MGNTASSTATATTSATKSSPRQFKNVYDIVDYIATHYILTSNFQSMKKLSEKAYCDKLVVLTSDIIQRHFNDMEITYLAQRVKSGVEVNELKQEKLTYIDRDSLDKIDVANDAQKSIHKKRVCIGIAKFYVKIAHIFSAIVMTINPIYTYKDVSGNTVKATLLQKNQIPKGAERRLHKLNICDNRIRALKRGEEYDKTTGEVSFQPNVCDFQNKPREKGDTTTTKTRQTLGEEPGIPELERLYLDDLYDYATGQFAGMSEETAKQYKKDVKTFYTAFTGKEEMPDTITRFSDIPLRDFSQHSGCVLPNAPLRETYNMKTSDPLFVAYAENIRQMIQSAAQNQSKLLEIINVLFSFVDDPYAGGGKRFIRIHPQLTETSLQMAVVNTRKYIVRLYTQCESDYLKGVQLFEAIVERKILETTERQIANMKAEVKKQVDDLGKGSKPPNHDSNLKEMDNHKATDNEPDKKDKTDAVLPSGTTPPDNVKV